MNTMLRIFTLLAFLTGTAFGQGSLTPPGAPAPTMKTLDQVEPRTPIDATNTPGDATSVFRITTSGSYYLTAPLAGVSGKNGISVEATNVTIDLQGFPVTGVPDSLDGVKATTGVRLTLRNGTITGWGEDGVDEFGGEASATDGIYENLRVTANGLDGLRLGEKAIVRACKLSENGVYGVSVNGLATISGCTANNNGQSGFYFGSGSVLDSVSSWNGSSGFEMWDEPALVKNCSAFDNTHAGIHISAGGKVTDCISRQNGIGISAGYFSTVTNCMVKNNPFGIEAGGACRIEGNMCEGNSLGIHTYASRNVIDGNQALNGGTGFKIEALFVDSKHNLIIRNTAVNNTTANYDIAADNRYGPIIDLTADGIPAVNGNSAADTTATTHPWANFTYGPTDLPAAAAR